MRKTALLTGVAGLFLMTAPAFAQNSTAPQTPAPAQTPATAPAAPQSLTLQPGSDVKGSDGTVLGKLEGVRTAGGGQELTVRGPDGQLRGVPTAGVHQDGAAVVVGWTSAQYQAASAIAGAPPAPAAPPATETPADPAMPGMPMPSTTPATPPAGEGTPPPPPADPVPPSQAPDATTPPAPGA